MPIPAALKKAWDEANLLTESGDPKGALAILRSEAWDACENGAQNARTLCFAGDAGTVLGEADAANQKRHWRRAHKNYGKALNFDAKDKETRRSMNKLASMMDEKSISMNECTCGATRLAMTMCAAVRRRILSIGSTWSAARTGYSGC